MNTVTTSLFDSGSLVEERSDIFSLLFNSIPTVQIASVIKAGTNLLSQQAFFQAMVDESLDIYVEEDFIIDDNFNFGTVTSNDLNQIFLREGSQIIVRSGATLTLETTNIFPCNGEIWESIIVENGASLVMKACGMADGMKMISAEPGSLVSIDDCRFLNSQTTIIGNEQLIGLECDDCNLTQINDCSFEHLKTGVLVTNADGVNIVPNSKAEANIFQNCEIGISFDNSNGNIKHNYIGFVARGIVTESSESLIEDNIITGTSSLDNTGQIAIELNRSMVDVVDNDIASGQIGIDVNACFSREGNQIEIYENWIDLSANNGQDDIAIYAGLSDNLLIKNNRLQGSGHRAGIVSRYGFFNEMSYNTFEADSYENGISLESGYENMITNNELQNDPTNAILNFSSTYNFFIDNNLNYGNVGLLIARNSDSLTIECNQFVSAGHSLSIASETGIQDFHQNEFGDETNARVLISPNLVLRNRFIYDETKSEHRPTYDPSGLFDPQPAGNNPTACDPFYGAGIPSSPPEFCERIMELSGSEYWIKLRQLLGRYFDTHGPNQLPDCISDCRMVELTQAEYALRTAREVSEETDFSEAVSDLEQLVAEQIVYFEEQPEQEEPCEGDDIFELYRTTYITLLKELNKQPHTEAEMAQTIETASLCVDDYGAPVIWARSILHHYPEYSYQENNCDLGVEARGSVFSDNTISYTCSPNPANDAVLITIDGDIEAYSSVTMVDSKGHIVLTKTIDQRKMELNTSALANGMYLIAVESVQGQTATKKIVVQH